MHAGPSRDTARLTDTLAPSCHERPSGGLWRRATPSTQMWTTVGVISGVWCERRQSPRPKDVFPVGQHQEGTRGVGVPSPESRHTPAPGCAVRARQRTKHAWSPPRCEHEAPQQPHGHSTQHPQPQQDTRPQQAAAQERTGVKRRHRHAPGVAGLGAGGGVDYMPVQILMLVQVISSAKSRSTDLVFHASLVAQWAPANSQGRCGPARKRGAVP
jgi:hypothetical protein